VRGVSLDIGLNAMSVVVDICPCPVVVIMFVLSVLCFYALFMLYLCYCAGCIIGTCAVKPADDEHPLNCTE
jgi:hypothetical protein